MSHSRGPWPVVRAAGLLALVLLPSCKSTHRVGQAVPGDAGPLPAPSASVAPTPPEAQGIALGAIAPTQSGSRIVLARHEERTFAIIADEDDEAIFAVDTESGEVRWITKTIGRPAELLLLGDGRVAAALRDNASVAIFQATSSPNDPMRLTASIAVADEPIALARTPDAEKVLVASDWGRTLSIVDVANGRAIRTYPIGRTPRSMVASRDGRTAFVTHATWGYLSIVDIAHASSTPARLPLAHDQTTGGGTLVSRLANSIVRLDAPVERVLIPRAFIRQNDGGYGVRHAYYPANYLGIGFEIATVSVTSKKLEIEQSYPTFLPEQEGPCAMTSAAAPDSVRNTIVTACVGANAIVAYDGARKEPNLAKRWSATVPAGATGLAVDASTARAYVWSQFEHAMSVVQYDGKVQVDTKLIARTRPLHESVALGRRLYFEYGNPKMFGKRDGYSCEGCHPDGRHEAFVRDFNPGPRRTVSIAGRVQHLGPMGWQADFASFSDAILAHQREFGGKGYSNDEVVALEAYAKYIKPPPAFKGALSDAARQGKALFESTGLACATCHLPETEFTDRKVHDVGSAGPGLANKSFLTPSLKHLRGVVDFNHDGRFDSLEDLLRGPHGKGKGSMSLSPEKVRAIAEYLRTL